VPSYSVTGRPLRPLSQRSPLARLARAGMRSVAGSGPRLRARAQRRPQGLLAKAIRLYHSFVSQRSRSVAGGGPKPKAGARAKRPGVRPRSQWANKKTRGGAKPKKKGGAKGVRPKSVARRGAGGSGRRTAKQREASRRNLRAARGKRGRGRGGSKGGLGRKR
jgi:hypothetical protein